MLIIVNQDSNIKTNATIESVRWSIIPENTSKNKLNNSERVDQCKKDEGYYGWLLSIVPLQQGFSTRNKPLTPSHKNHKDEEDK